MATKWSLMTLNSTHTDKKRLLSQNHIQKKTHIHSHQKNSHAVNSSQNLLTILEFNQYFLVELPGWLSKVDLNLQDYG